MMSSRHTAPALILLTATLGSAQAPPAATVTTLTVKGYSGQAPVIQVRGKSYVDIESLTRLTNGALTFQENRVTLSFPCPSAVPASTPPDQPAKLSRDFVQAVIGVMSLIAEWRTGLVDAVRNTNPLTQEWADGYRRNVDSRLAIASTTVTTDPDRSLLPLLRNEFNAMQALSDKYVALRKGQTFVSPDALDGDSLNQQVQNCARGLASESAGAPFADVAACH